MISVFKRWILAFGVKKILIISTIAVVGVTGTTVAITSVKKPVQVEEEKIVINTQGEEDQEVEEKEVEETKDEVVANQEVVMETTPQETETETVKEQTTTNATTTNNSSTGNVSTDTSNSENNDTDVNNNMSNNNSNMEKPNTEESKVETPTEREYQSITLYKKTTYNGFEGYFTLSQNIMDVDLVKYGIAESNDSISLYFTEYVDLDTGIYVRFACHGDVMESKFMDFVWKVGPGSVYVKTTK